MTLIWAAILIQAQPLCAKETPLPDEDSASSCAIDPASAAAERAMQEAGEAARLEKIVKRYKAFEAWRACLIYRADALATQAKFDAGKARSLAVHGCAPEYREFLLAAEATGVDPQDPWHDEIFANAMAAATAASEGRLDSPIEPSPLP